MADLAERRRSQTELRIALWTLVLTVVTASALVSKSYGHMEEAIVNLQAEVHDMHRLLDQHDRRIQSLEDLPEHRHRLMQELPATLADDTGTRNTR